MKQKTLFYCTECGNELSRWAGKCPACGAWNSIVEQPAPGKKSSGRGSWSGETKKACPVTELESSEEIRFPTGMGELDRVLGGGAVKGSLVLVGGAPGIGKSTLSLQLALTNNSLKTLYVSGEESGGQLKLRAIRLEVDSENLLVMTETDVEIICEQIKNGIIVDMGPLGTLYPAVSGKWEEDPKDLALADMTPRVNYKGSDDIMAAIKGATLSWATEKDEKEGVETPDDDTTNTGNQGGNNNPPSGELEG